TVVEDDDEAEITEVELHAEVAEVDEINESAGTERTDVVEMTEVDAEDAEVADEAPAEPSLAAMTEFCGGFFDKFEHIEREIDAKAAQIEGALTDRLCAAEAELARLATT